MLSAHLSLTRPGLGAAGCTGQAGLLASRPPGAHGRGPPGAREPTDRLQAAGLWKGSGAAFLSAGGAKAGCRPRQRKLLPRAQWREGPGGPGVSVQRVAWMSRVGGPEALAVEARCPGRVDATPAVSYHQGLRPHAAPPCRWMSTSVTRAPARTAPAATTWRATTTAPALTTWVARTALCPGSLALAGPAEVGRGLQRRGGGGGPHGRIC